MTKVTLITDLDVRSQKLMVRQHQLSPDIIIGPETDIGEEYDPSHVYYRLTPGHAVTLIRELAFLLNAELTLTIGSNSGWTQRIQIFCRRAIKEAEAWRSALDPRDGKEHEGCAVSDQTKL